MVAGPPGERRFSTCKRSDSTRLSCSISGILAAVNAGKSATRPSLSTACSLSRRSINPRTNSVSRLVTSDLYQWIHLLAPLCFQLFRGFFLQEPTDRRDNVGVLSLHRQTNINLL